MKDINVRLGYCCINLSLTDQKITVNRGMIRKTFHEKGITYCGELAHQNIKDILKILHWNLANDIYVYRMSSDIFPWMSEYEIQSLPNFTEILSDMQEIGKFVVANQMRVSMHPGQFNVLPSPKPDVVTKTIKDLNQHCEIMDLMNLPINVGFPINIHVGGTYGDKITTAHRFCENFQLLTPNTQARLVIENDDKITQYSVVDLYQLLYLNIGIPITFDFHHHRFNTSDLSEETALKLAATTWRKYTPLTHYSSSKKTFEDSSVIARSHADYIYEQINNYGQVIDIEIEAKAKDLAVLKYREGFRSLLESYIEFDHNKNK